MAEFNYNFSFDAKKVAPATVGGTQLPVSEADGWPVQIIKAEIVPTKAGDGSAMIVFTLEILDGEHAGSTGAYRINKFSSNEKAVEIADRQLSALCWVTGFLNPTAQTLNTFCGIPFRAVVGLQKNLKEGENYTEVKGVKDINGDNPGAGKVAEVKSAKAAPSFASKKTAPVAKIPDPEPEHVWEPNDNDEDSADGGDEGTEEKPFWMNNK